MNDASMAMTFQYYVTITKVLPCREDRDIFPLNPYGSE
jgi:hypothetical protein